MREDVHIPDIGSVENAAVAEISVKIGDRVQIDTPLLIVESDKTTFEIPSPVAGTVVGIALKAGDPVRGGTAAMVIDTGAIEESGPMPMRPSSASHAAVLVIGAGPGGYTAAFRAADLGLDVTLIERRERLGGVCLNVGCIPSKALLHAAKLIDDARDFAGNGIDFGKPAIDLDRLRNWKDSIVTRLTGGLAGLARQRKITVIRGEARFSGTNGVTVRGPDGEETVSFDKAIIAAGSEPADLSFLPKNDPRIVDSSGALELNGTDGRLLVLGGGVIGLEMATVYHALGARVTVVELTDQLVPGADRDLVAPLTERLAGRYEGLRLGTRVTGVEAQENGLMVRFEGPDGTDSDRFDRILVAIGRRPNAASLDLELAGIAADARGFIPVDHQMRTTARHIFAIGDIVGQPMLAHKASHQGKVAAEAVAGHRTGFDAKAIASVAYTDPEIAWVGLTETEATSKGIAFEKSVFPWAASGRSLSLGRDEGLTKLMFDPRTNRLVGAGIVGPNAGDLIAETAFAIEMGAVADDIGLTIHPHPTLSETVAMAAEMFAGTITDLYLPKRR